MTTLARALLGVALSSCVTLFVDPISRPFMTGALPKPTDVQIIESVPGPKGAGANMPLPKSIADCALWMEIACEKINSGQKLSQQELKSLVRLSKGMSEFSPTGEGSETLNAFWPQMTAVFLDQLGDDKGARDAWLDAAKRIRWRDYQASRLLDASQQMADHDGAMAWHLAGLYYQRRFAIGPAIREFARKSLAGCGLTKPDDILWRYRCLQNAWLVAANARSIEMLRYAGDIADLAYETPTQIYGPRPKDDKTIRAGRGAFYAALVTIGHASDADNASAIYNEIDSRPVLATSFRPEDTAARWAAFTIFTATLPGALLAVTLAGLVAWPLGLLLLRHCERLNGFSWIQALVLGVVLSGIVFGLTASPLASFVVFACALFLVFSPKSVRSKLPGDLGPMTSWIVAILGLAFLAAITVSIGAASTPGRVLLPNVLGVMKMSTSHSASTIAGTAVLIVSLVFLVAPMWASASRVSTPYALGLTMRSFGRALVIIGLAGVVILGPLCVYGDYQSQHTFTELVGNEPQHYFIAFQ